MKESSSALNAEILKNEWFLYNGLNKS